MVAAEVSPVPPYAESRGDPEAAEAAAVEILARLEKAAAPALLLCVEVRRYGLEQKVTELARRLAIPAATTFMARGILAGTDAPLIGTYLGLAGDRAIREAIEGSDALLMLGVIVCDMNFAVSERLIDRRRSMLAVDRTVRMAHHVYPDVPLAALVDALLERAKPLRSLGCAPCAPADYPCGLADDDAPIAPIDIASAVNDLFARNGRMPIAADVGDCLFTAMDIAYTELVAPAYYATMGAGVPMGLGIQIASARRPLILVGDGAFQMTGWELGNARRLGLNPIVLLFNNAAWGMLKVLQPDTRYNDLDDWRFAELAAALGGKACRVRTRAELARALAAAYGDESTWHLIDIVLPCGAYSRTLNRFAKAVKARSVLGKG
jgi:indolepyruvate decarboxylase